MFGGLLRPEKAEQPVSHVFDSLEFSQPSNARLEPQHDSLVSEQNGGSKGGLLVDVSTDGLQPRSSDATGSTIAGKKQQMGDEAAITDHSASPQVRCILYLCCRAIPAFMSHHCRAGQNNAEL